MIICLGTTPAVQRSMNFDHLTIDNTNRTSRVEQYASGKSVNAARVLHTLAAPVTCTGFVGGDSGQFLLNDLDKIEIPHCFIRVDPPTRMCITLVDRSSNTATELIEESGAVGPHAYEHLLQKFNELLSSATGVLLSGSLPPDAPADFYANCVAAASAAGKFTILDAVGEPLRRALAKHPTVIKPNRQELSQTVNAPVGTDDELKSSIKQLLEMGPQWAVITDGEKETIASDGKQFWKISTPRVAVISPIGSGDSFAAGLAAGLAEGQEVPQACRLAAACGAANAMTDKAGHLKKSNVDALLPTIAATLITS